MEAPSPVRISPNTMVQPTKGTIRTKPNNRTPMMSEPSIHAEAIRELGSSFEAEVAPRVVEIEGQSVRLTGSAEAQYEIYSIPTRPQADLNIP